MMRTLLLFLLMTCASIANACECQKKLGSNFLNKVKHFAVVALVTYHVDEQTRQPGFTVEKLYKGDSTQTIEISGKDGCDRLALFKEGEKLILGLFEAMPGTRRFYLCGCITSVLYVSNDRAVARNKTQSHPAQRRNRIGVFTKGDED